ncbi:MAG: TolC family protein, partial [Prevotella sp.]|nr:TolC family protein [Prevotella sp.]
MKRFAYILSFSICLTAQAQKLWTVDECMQYAVMHNHEVRLQSIGLDDYKAEKVRAIGSFLPEAEGNIGGQYNFGRAIDPETNTYTNVSTFYNSYGLSVGIPVFDGFQRYNNLRAAKANVLMGKSQLMAQKDATAQKVLETYTLSLYYKGCIEFATQKRAESEMLLRQTKVMAEVGQKGETDVAQMQATYAADDYEVTHQQGLYDNAILTLKQLMNYPINDTLEITDCKEESLEVTCAEVFDIYEHAKLFYPDIKQAEYNLQSAKYAYHSSKGALFPSISLGAGISTTYYKQLNVPLSTRFSEQFRYNAGQYVYASLSIPIFNRLNTLTNIRRQRNNV